MITNFLRQRLKTLIPPKYLEMILRRRAINKMHKYGVEAFHAIDRVLTECHCPYWLEFGTLLGAYRDHAFIRHDTDIDLGIELKSFSLEILDRMKKEGFEIHTPKVFSDNGRCYVFGGKYKGIVIDIHVCDIDDFYLTSYESRPLTNCSWKESAELGKNLIYELKYPYEGFKTIEFYDRKVLIPVNAGVHLSMLYGSNYMIPIEGDFSQGQQNSYGRLIPEDERVGIFYK